MVRAKKVERIEIQVSLSPDAAQTIMDLCSKVGGTPDGERRHITALQSALRSCGFKYTDDATSVFHDAEAPRGSVYFR